MFCDEALDAVEPIAAGELTAEGRLADHYASCRQCAAALASARRIDQLLRARPAPSAPAQFTARTLALVRRDRWRREQVLDTGFNLVLLVVALVIVGGVWLLLQRTGVGAAGTDAMTLFGNAVTALVRRAAPAVPLYAGATVLLATALGVWWWAEKDVAS